MNTMVNPFTASGFDVTTLTSKINEISHVPGRIEDLGLFEVGSVPTTSISIERKGDALIIVRPTPRGAPGVTMDHAKRELFNLTIPHFQVNDAVYADEVQNVRAFGEAASMETVAGKIAEKWIDMTRSMAATEEFSRMGAVKGVVTYADGSELDLFTEFGVTPEAEIDFALTAPTPAEGALRRKCAGIKRRVMDLLGGVTMRGLHAFCGDDFFDDLLCHPEVRETYKGWSEAKILRESYVGNDRGSYGIFEFGGIVWENYRGAVGATNFIETDACHIFPVGVPGLFQTRYAPADYMETVNTMGLRLYSRQSPEPNGKSTSLEVQMNALHYCTRPRVLMTGVRSVEPVIAP